MTGIAEKQKTEMEAVNTVNTAEVTADAENVDYSVESTAKRIQPLLNNIANDKLQISFEIYDFKKNHKNNKKKLKALQEATGLQREQFRKLQVVGEYCKVKSPNCHTCGNYKKLGFEKIYRITQLERENLYVDSENFAIEKILSVRMLEKIVMVLNKDITLTIEAAYERVIHEKGAARNQESIVNQQSEVIETIELQETIKQQKERIKKLMESNKQKDERIKQLERELQEAKAQLQVKEDFPKHEITEKLVDNKSENAATEDSDNIQESMPVSVDDVYNGTEPTTQNVIDLPNANNTQDLASSYN